MPGEHGVDDAVREGVLAHIPVDQHATVELGYLGIQHHLRPLRIDPPGSAERRCHGRAEQFAEPEGTGEHHRRQHLGAAMPAQVAQHLEAGVLGMCSGAAECVLQDAATCRRRGRLGEVDVEQQRRGEVTDQAVDIGVPLIAPEQRHIQQEALPGRPAGQGVGEGRREGHRRRDTAPAGRGIQRVPDVRGQPVPAPGGVPRVILLSDRNQWQARRIGQFREPVAPPLPIRVGPRIGLLRRLRCGHPVFAVRVGQRSELDTAVQGREIRHQGAVAHGVGGLHVQIDVQAGLTVREQRQAQFEDLIGQLLMRLAALSDGELFGDLIRRQVPQVGDRDREVAVLGFDALRTVGQELHAQHGMPRRQSRCGGGQSLGIDAVAVEFDIEVSGDAAQLLVVLPADPHGVLHRGQAERLIVCRINLRYRHFRALQATGGRQQFGPGGDGGLGGQRREVDVDALLPPASGERHHPDRVQPLADEVGARVEGVGGRTQQFGNLLADGLRIHCHDAHKTLPNTLKTGCPNFD
ncbi:Uncharacterised protein [Mycobacteroides abscessus subsp. abscessus]|nr:Uncharacterised protein [Mycobacteroides abscessus subsp. abscessus]